MYIYVYIVYIYISSLEIQNDLAIGFDVAWVVRSYNQNLLFVRDHGRESVSMIFWGPGSGTVVFLDLIKKSVRPLQGNLKSSECSEEASGIQDSG